MAIASSESRTMPSQNWRRQRRIPLPVAASLCSPKLSLLLAIFTTLLILFHLQMITSSSWVHFMHQWRKSTSVVGPMTSDCSQELESTASKLREAVTFLPLKDLRYSSKPLEGHTWFMSSTLDTHEKGQVQYQEFPSKASKSRVLCLKGRDKHDGSWNSYALAWPQTLPLNATLMEGLTFVSYNHYNYDNIWHGLSAAAPFIAWHIANNCSSSPERWVLYHWGELRTSMGPWLSSLIAATFRDRQPLNIEKFDREISCFERAVVMRHNEGGMSRERRVQVYDLLRCKARISCNVSLVNTDKSVGVTMFMRTGPRSFKNDSAVIGIFREACQGVEGCRLTVAYANNLSFCEQVKLMRSTDVLVSPHGAQLTNMFLMDRNSSVMEFFPKGWLKLAGVGQYVYHWIASWSGMNHRGAWRDPRGNMICPFPEDDRRCMAVYKNARIGYDERYFYEWARSVVVDVKLRKAMPPEKIGLRSASCGCTSDQPAI